MKYILWGAGKRGKRALNLLGADNVIAFIDCDVAKVGGECLGKPIISMEQAIKDFDKCIIIITPYNGSEEIAYMLDKRNCYNYFKLSDCPLGVSLDDEEQDVFSVYNFKYSDGICAIDGITWFSLIVYDYLQNQLDMKVVLIPQEEMNSQLLSVVAEEYRVMTLKEAMDRADKLEIIELNSYLEQNTAIFNKDILKFKNIHQGKRCFIVATGPSLRVEDLDMLKTNNEVCISMNRIYNIFDKTDWRPDYFVIEDAKMIEDLAKEIAELKLDYKFVAANPKCYWEQEKAASSIKYNMIVQNYKNSMPGFSSNVENCVYNGRTVTYVCIQLAAYMGFKEIYLLGVDFNYSADLYAPENHFQGYHNSNTAVRLNPIHPELMILAYEKAKQYAQLHGIKIYNATRGGKLEVFERVNIDEVF